VSKNIGLEKEKPKKGGIGGRSRRLRVSTQRPSSRTVILKGEQDLHGLRGEGEEGEERATSKGKEAYQEGASFGYSPKVVARQLK